ncbi:MAG: hypothetical protein GX992_10085 [Clostridium sp.]|nr:hypothetical protein [Clostridium sp.]
MNNITGVNDLCLVFTGPVNFDRFTFSAGGGGVPGISGDINCDGKVDTLDTTLLKRYLLRAVSLTGDGLKNADINGDGSVDPLDLVLLKRIILKQ